MRPDHGGRAATFRTLAVPIVILIARIALSGISQADILGDNPAGPIIAAVAILARAVLKAMMAAASGMGLLENLGLVGAKGSAHH